MADKSKSDIKKELNTLWKSTVDQLDEIKDVIVKSSHAGKARLDAAFLERERDDRLRELGALVVEAAEGDLPAPWREKVNEIKELDKQIASQRSELDDLVKDWTAGQAPAEEGGGEADRPSPPGGETASAAAEERSGGSEEERP